MSYSSRVKDELSRIIADARHCCIAEIAAIISLLGNVGISEDDKITLSIRTEHPGVARKCFTLLKKTYNIGTDITIRRNTFLNKSHAYTVTVKNDIDAREILLSTKLMNRYGEIGENLSLRDNMVIAKTCCRRAFVRGAFLATGSISDPGKFYHFEIVCPTEAKAIQLKETISSFKLDAKIVLRKKTYVVYLKEGDQIVEILGLMDAPTALMELENIRIIKDMRNNINRKVNCETANISKTVSAAYKQTEEIKLIMDTVGLEKLPDNLREIALIRLENPEASLKELGEALETPVGKSGANHRLRKISEFADELRSS